MKLLVRGTLRVKFYALICDTGSVQSLLFGADDGLFCISIKIGCTQDLLYFWLYETAAIGGFFRDAYDLSQQFVLESHKLRPSRTSILSCNRRTANDAFAVVLQSIVYLIFIACFSAINLRKMTRVELVI